MMPAIGGYATPFFNGDAWQHATVDEQGNPHISIPQAHHARPAV
jgi:hypothetical protein